jgi:amino-acid N-acetyltransferase
MKIKYFKPTLKDINSMQNVVKEEVEKGLILNRSNDEIANSIRSYTVAKVDENIVGFVALHIHTDSLAEIRSLVVKKEFRDIKIASNLIEKSLNEAKSLDIKKVLVLTYESNLFKKFNFIEIDKESIPEHKIWTDCIKCKHFPICNEIALIKEIALI